MALTSVILYRGQPQGIGNVDPVPEAIDLMNSLAPWVILSENGVKDFQDGIATLKSEITAESQVASGSTYLADAYGNVSLSIRLEGSPSDLVARREAFRQMAAFADTALEFQVNKREPRPVWIKVQTTDDAGPRYALVHRIDMSLDGDLLSPDTLLLTMSIEREPFWRGVAPGDNPKKWSLYKNGGSNISLRTSAADQLELDTAIQNYAGAGDNQLRIPVADIDGDHPALVCLSVNPTEGKRVWIGKKTYTPGIPPTLMFAKATGTLNNGAGATNVTISTQTGATYSSSAFSNVVRAAFGAAATGEAQLATTATLSARDYAGKYLVWLRADVTTGTPTDISIHLRVVPTNLSAQYVRYDSVKPVTVTAAGQVKALLMGEIELPLAGDYYNDPDGTGLDITGLEDTFRIQVWADSRTTTTAVNLDMSDVVMLPVDEGAMVVEALSMPALADYFIDNTGYFGRARGERTIANSPNGSGLLLYTDLEVNGTYLRLEPERGSVLYFFTEETVSGEVVSRITGSDGIMAVAVNIVPLWRSIRDV